MRSSATKLFVVIASVLLFCTCGTFAFGQFRDMLGRFLEVKLKRNRPPQVQLTGMAIRLRVSSPAPSGRDYTAHLQARLESGLFAQDSRLRPEDDHPETVIVCQITRLDANDNHWEKRTTNQVKKVGKKLDYVPVTENYRIVKGGINISYQARTAKTNAVLDAQNVQKSFGSEYLDGNKALSAHEVREWLVNEAVGEIVARLAVTTEEVTVYLPQGKLKEISRMGQSGLWERMYENLWKLDVQKDSEQEAYRQYGMGISNEAKAYKSEDPKTTWTLLQEASINYNKAIELKPGEKYFREPLTRIQQAIVQYKRIAEQQNKYKRSKPASGTARPAAAADSRGIRPAGSPAPAPPQPISDSQPAMTNQQVLELVSSGLDEANLIATIKSAPVARFDLSPQGLQELLRNKVPNNIITVMRQRQNTRPAKRVRK